jgi:hypothetical protein
MPKPKPHLATFIAACAWLSFSGCSLIGFTIGALSDAGSPNEYNLTPTGVDSIEVGSTIEVTKTDSTIISGHFEQLDAVRNEQYSAKYKSAMNSLPIGNQMPALGDSILIVTHEVSGRKTYNGQLLGFKEGVIRVSDNDVPVSVHLDAVDTLYHKTSVVRGDVLRYHMNNGDIPFLSIKTALVMNNERGTERIPLTDILKVRELVSHHGALIGLGMGAAIDVTYVILFKIEGER